MYFHGQTLEWSGPVSRAVAGSLTVEADNISEATAKLLHALKLRSGAKPVIAKGRATFPIRGAIAGSIQLCEVRRTTLEDFFFQHLHECKDASGELAQARLLLEQRQEDAHAAVQPE